MITEMQFFKDLCACSFIKRIILYGSRARGEAQKKSDIDLAIDISNFEEKHWEQVMNIIENADTLLKIDCVHYNALPQESPLKKSIDAEGVVLFRRSLIKEKLGKALDALEVVLQKPMEADRTNVDATIQRFEFSIELFCKFLKKIIEEKGEGEVNFKRDILEQSYKGGLIEDEKIWLSMLRDRNLTSHTYDEILADQIYQRIKKYLPVMRKAYERLIQML